MAWAKLYPYNESASSVVADRALISVNTFCFCITSQWPDPLLSTQAVAPGTKSLAYGKLTTLLACDTRMVCKWNTMPVPVIDVLFKLVNANSITAEFILGSDSTR